MRPIGLLLGLTSLLLAGPAAAELDLMSLVPGEPIEGLTAVDLEEVAPERLLCRNMLVRINDLVAVLERSPDPNESFKTELQDARNSWPSTRGRCDAAIGELPEGWARSVLRTEFERVISLWMALEAVARAHDEGLAKNTIDQAIATYQQQLDAWQVVFERSVEFWDGAWLTEQPAEGGCVEKCQEEVRSVAKTIWLLTTRPQSERSDEALVEVDLGLKTGRTELSRCETSSPLQTVELRLLGRLLDTYNEALLGLRNGDDLRLRRAMEAEQKLAARRRRCRQEHAQGNPSTVCSP